MKGFDVLCDRLRRNCPDLELRPDEPMSRHTTFQVGGPATLMALPKTEAEAVGCARAAWELGVRCVFVGNGSNLLVDDAGVNAFVVKTVPALSHQFGTGEALSAGAGGLLSALASEAARRGLTGLEFAAGIPGSLGGAVLMNAGAYGGEIAQLVESVRLLEESGEIVELPAEQCDFSYRHSRFSQGGSLILSATLILSPGDPAAIRTTMRELNNRRREKQPLDLPSAGSTFKRPKTGYAAALIEQCGLKGFRIGGAQVSSKHAGFIVNAGGATCRDILDLMGAVQERVFQTTGVELEPEVKYLK